MCGTWCSRTQGVTVNECIHRQGEYDTNYELLGIKLPKSTLPIGGRVWTEKQMVTGVLGFRKQNDNLVGRN